VPDRKAGPESDRLFAEDSMLGGRHRFEFVGREPLVFWVVSSLLFANTVLMLLLEFGGKYFLPKHAPEIVYWYAGRSIEIQLVLVAQLAAIFVVFRKRVRYIRPKWAATGILFRVPR